jgi:hypothetical protein
MKALLICSDSNAHLFKSLGMDPWLLPVSGKPVIEYQLESLAQLGLQDIRLIGADPAIEKRYGNGESLGLNLSYAPLPTQDSLQSILRHNRHFVATTGLVIVRGLNLLAPLFASHCLRLEQSLRLGEGIIGLTETLIEALLHGDVEEAYLATLPLLYCCESWQLKSLDSYFKANLELPQRWRECMSMPAYGKRENYLCGSKLTLADDLICRGNGFIGNNSVIQPQVELDEVCLGQGVVVASGTHLHRCVVLDRTWIGPHLTLENKIVVGRRLIDPVSNEVILLDEPGWLDDLSEDSLSSPMGRLLASVYWLLLLPFYNWLAPKQKQSLSAYRIKNEYLLLPHFTRATDWQGRLFERLGLDRVPRLRAVMRNQLALVGQLPIATGTVNPYSEYLPAAMAYSEALGSNGIQAILDDASYPLFRNSGKEVFICLQILWRSLTSGRSSRHAVNQTDFDPEIFSKGLVEAWPLERLLVS